MGYWVWDVALVVKRIGYELKGVGCGIYIAIRKCQLWGVEYEIYGAVQMRHSICVLKEEAWGV